MGTALLGARDVERRTARHLVLAPVPSLGLVAGRFIGGLLTSVAILLPVMGIAVLTGVIQPPVTHWPALIALFASTALCAAGIGAALGAWFRRSRTVAMMSSIIATYLFFLGGGFTTIAFLPNWLRAVSDFVPIRYAIDGMRQSLFYPDLHGVGVDLLVLAFTAAVATGIGAVMARRSWSL
jgi:ABC-type multidrug transport system permease subunit